MCSKTGKVPSWVGAAGTPVFPGELRIDVPVVPEVQRLRDGRVHEDVAVSVGAGLAGDHVGDQGLPDVAAGEPVDGKVVLVLERHDRAADDRVEAARLPEATSSGGMFG